MISFCEFVLQEYFRNVNYQKQLYVIDMFLFQSRKGTQQAYKIIYNTVQSQLNQTCRTFLFLHAVSYNTVDKDIRVITKMKSYIEERKTGIIHSYF